MSPEKASLVVERYGTLRYLWEAFRQAELEGRMSIQVSQSSMTVGISSLVKQRKKFTTATQPAELLLTGLGKGRRKIGDSLSKKVYHLFMDDIYRDEHGRLDVDDYD
jgi:hypothetical protein